MEWVETTGRTVEEAKEQALDQLGVLEEDAEFEVLEEPKPGLFGRVRGNARVKARVEPTSPPPKQERRKRNAHGRDAGKDGGAKDGADSRQGGAGGGGRTDDTSRSEPTQSAGKDSRSSDDRPTRGDRSGSRPAPKKEREMMPESEQRGAGEEFLRGLVDAFGFDAAITSSLDEEGLLAFEIDGEALGLLIGPGLNTLDAIQEVCRNSIQRQADGREYGKVVLDVADARKDRTASLEEFVRQEAARVIDSGDEVIFEIMSRGDRKVVHDVVGEFEELSTESVGEDPRRRVVLRLA